MDGIVLELQRDAMSSKMDIINLLRKAYTIARKLSLNSFMEWCQFELNGYSDIKKIPDYRRITGELRGLNPYRGWIPCMIQDIKTFDLICRIKLHDSIPKIQQIKENNGSIILPFDDAKSMIISECFGELTKFRLHLDKATVYEIPEIVKTNILDWALTLEENNVIGENLRFTTEEKDIALKTPVVNYITHFYSDVKDSQIQQGTHDSMQETAHG